MRYCAINTETNTVVTLPLPQGQPIPANIEFAWLPRIRCRDCPGKSYTAGPDTTVQNFEVAARLGKGGGGSNGSSAQ
jgi:SWI/SNF-related matrix-associated actin-dependent regulator of chromatin subfamily B protein 1